MRSYFEKDTRWLAQKVEERERKMEVLMAIGNKKGSDGTDDS